MTDLEDVVYVIFRQKALDAVLRIELTSRLQTQRHQSFELNEEESKFASDATNKAKCFIGKNYRL